MFTFFSMVVWAVILGWLIPKVFRFAVNNPEAVKGGLGYVRRAFRR